ALPFGVSNPTRSVFRSVPGSEFISGGRWRAFYLSTFSTLSESFATELIGFAIRIRIRERLHGNVISGESE
ncbi:hypothetical protein, partial [Streptomyces sp. NPDC019539]|uniref:hypothetical protein n=1 Tax=Streptomyces sp. NPDC019539 TaxID=3365063 RepID=UPI0037B838C8